MSYRLGVDVGGTFTDLVLVSPDGVARTCKVLSTTANYAEAIIAGVRELTAQAAIAAPAIGEIIHGTTVATNAILERRGARDRPPDHRGLSRPARDRPPAPARASTTSTSSARPRWCRAGGAARSASASSHRGEVITPLDRDGAAAADRPPARARACESIAVCFLHAYANPAHERAGRRDDPRARAPRGAHPLVRDPARDPRVRAHQHRGHQRLRAAGDGPLPRVAAKRELAPAGGPGAAAHHAVQRRRDDRRGRRRAAGARRSSRARPRASSRPRRWPAPSAPPNVHHASTWAARPRRPRSSRTDEIKRTGEFEVGGAHLAGQPAQQGRRLPAAGARPSTSRRSARAAAASSASTAGGALQVGPRSAGAVPGPVCYGQGGAEADPDRRQRGARLPATRAACRRRCASTRASARRALAEQVAAPLGLDAAEAAHGVYLLGGAGMVAGGPRGHPPSAAATRATSRWWRSAATGRSSRPRWRARSGSARVVVPPAPGVFSALGLLEADVEHHLVRTFLRPLDALDAGGARRPRSATLEARGARPCSGRGPPGDRVRDRARRIDLQLRGPVVRAARCRARPRGPTRRPDAALAEALRARARADLRPPARTAIRSRSSTCA